jgi:hypothetical protein
MKSGHTPAVGGKINGASYTHNNSSVLFSKSVRDFEIYLYFDHILEVVHDFLQQLGGVFLSTLQ